MHKGPNCLSATVRPKPARLCFEQAKPLAEQRLALIAYILMRLLSGPTTAHWRAVAAFSASQTANLYSTERKAEIRRVADRQAVAGIRPGYGPLELIEREVVVC